MIINYLYAFLISFDIAVFVPFRQHDSISCDVVLQVFIIFFYKYGSVCILKKEEMCEISN